MTEEAISSIYEADKFKIIVTLLQNFGADFIRLQNNIVLLNKEIASQRERIRHLEDKFAGLIDAHLEFRKLTKESLRMLKKEQKYKEEKLKLKKPKGKKKNGKQA